MLRKGREMLTCGEGKALGFAWRSWGSGEPVRAAGECHRQVIFSLFWDFLLLPCLGGSALSLFLLSLCFGMLRMVVFLQEQPPAKTFHDDGDGARC